MIRRDTEPPDWMPRALAELVLTGLLALALASIVAHCAPH